MDLDELQSVRDRERQTDKLQQLRASFYADAGELIQQLREQRQRAADRADDPFDAPEVSRLSDEIDTAEQTVEAIYEKRVGKIVKAASFAAADLPAESDGMTDEEEELFETLVADIKANRQHVLDVLAGETDDAAAESEAGSNAAAAPDTEPAPSPAEETPAEAAGETPEPPSPAESALADGPPTDVGADDGPTEVSAADVMGTTESDEEPTSDATPAEEPDEPEPPAPTPGASGGGTEPESDPQLREDGGNATEPTGVDRETVRITADVGDIFGVDEREYDLAEDDVVTLPEANAEPLVDRDAAERL